MNFEKGRFIMAKINGVYSKIPANIKLTNGYDLYGWVMRMNGFPSFWGRSISGENRLAKEEIDFLHDKKCRIIPIFDDVTETDVSATNGSGDAARAIEAAITLGVPKNEGIALYAEIRDDWSVNHNWMISFTYTLFENGFNAGFIGNTDSSQNFNFGRQCSHYYYFMNDAISEKVFYWATHPKIIGEPEIWSPYCPSALLPENICLWSCHEEKIIYRDKTVDKVYGRDEMILNHMW